MKWPLKKFCNKFLVTSSGYLIIFCGVALLCFRTLGNYLALQEHKGHAKYAKPLRLLCIHFCDLCVTCLLNRVAVVQESTKQQLNSSTNVKCIKKLNPFTG